MRVFENESLKVLAEMAGVTPDEMSNQIVDYFMYREYLYADDYGMTVSQIIENEGLAPHEICMAISDKFTTDAMEHIQRLMFGGDGNCEKCGACVEPYDTNSRMVSAAGYYTPAEYTCIHAEYHCPYCGHEFITDGSELN